MLTTIDRFGLIKTKLDVHTLGITTIAALLRDCGYYVSIAGDAVMEAVIDLQKVNNLSKLRNWIAREGITYLGFSYRLDPREGKDYFCRLYYLLKDTNSFECDGGTLKEIFFAGLPDACDEIAKELGSSVKLFPGDEMPIESLTKIGVPTEKLPRNLMEDNQYDAMRWEFAEKIITDGKYTKDMVVDHWGYSECGKSGDTFEKKLKYCKARKSLPLIRVHVGPYEPNREEAVKKFLSWCEQLAKGRLLDVLSIGSSQLTQSNFGEDWEGKANGGGVPVNSELEYHLIKGKASPMLVRTYAGTKDVPAMAQMHERTLNISWHALSYWWFCEIDGRGSNSVLDNLKEHFEAIRYIAHTRKPLEPNVPHHFAFRGADDISYVVSGFLAAKTAKKMGVGHLILQNMLNTPKSTWGIQDLAKGRAMLKLVRELEDSAFKVSLQTRAGLDYFSPDIEKAKVQLAAVTAMMDDIEPGNDDSPEIIHVVSYCEAVRLATPDVINESIKITLTTLSEYRLARRLGKVPNMNHNSELNYRYESIYAEAKEAIALLESNIANLYTPQGLFEVFRRGFFPVPYMIDNQDKYPHARKWQTSVHNGGVIVVDEKGEQIDTIRRYKIIINNFE